jgi:glycerol-3-phosphate cytidylyltransferase-like family protein
MQVIIYQLLRGKKMGLITWFFDNQETLKTLATILSPFVAIFGTNWLTEKRTSKEANAKLIAEDTKSKDTKIEKLESEMDVKERAEILAAIKAVDTKITDGLSNLDTKITDVDKKVIVGFAMVDIRFEKIDDKFNYLTDKVNELITSLNKLLPSRNQIKLMKQKNN